MSPAVPLDRQQEAPERGPDGMLSLACDDNVSATKELATPTLAAQSPPPPQVELTLPPWADAGIDHDSTAHGGLRRGQAWRDVVLEPTANELGDAIQVRRLVVAENPDRPALLTEHVLEAAEPWVPRGSGQKLRARSSSNSASSTGRR